MIAPTLYKSAVVVAKPRGSAIPALAATPAAYWGTQVEIPHHPIRVVSERSNRRIVRLASSGVPKTRLTLNFTSSRCVLRQLLAARRARRRGPPLCVGIRPQLGVLHLGPDVEDEECRQKSEDEHDAPIVRTGRGDEQPYDRGV